MTLKIKIRCLYKKAQKENPSHRELRLVIPPLTNKFLLQHFKQSMHPVKVIIFKFAF